MARAILISLLSVSILFFSCSTLPKPQELVSLENMRQGEQFEEAQKKQAELIAESEEAYKKAVESWEDEDIELAKHWAFLGSIHLRTAMAIIEQERQRIDLKQNKSKLKEVQSQKSDIDHKNKEAAEKIALQEQLAIARKSASEKEAQLSKAQQLAAAEQLVNKAQLALKMADTVDASQYAAETYTLAQSLLTKATSSLKVGNSAEASSAAELAKSKAELAYQNARPQYMKAKETASRQAENQALQRDAAAISGVTVKLKTSGDTQQLILPVLNLYKRNAITPKSEKMIIINAIGALLKKYPNYPVIINGYTSYRVRASQRYSVSQARAQQIANHFASMGLPLKRFAISGLGGENLIARPYNYYNDRVEVILLFQ